MWTGRSTPLSKAEKRQDSPEEVAEALTQALETGEVTEQGEDWTTVFLLNRTLGKQ